jgi:hypothetical protein
MVKEERDCREFEGSKEETEGSEVPWNSKSGSGFHEKIGERLSWKQLSFR